MLKALAGDPLTFEECYLAAGSEIPILLGPASAHVPPAFECIVAPRPPFPLWMFTAAPPVRYRLRADYLLSWRNALRAEGML